MKIERVWAMPNKRTFQIKPIKRLIDKYRYIGDWIDPFPYPFKEDALDYLKKFKDNSVDGVLFDPPYSARQLKECYENKGQHLTFDDTKNTTWMNWRKEIARVVKPNGYVISFGWCSTGMGNKKLFKKIEILLVCHGGQHHDTIVVVEQKVNKTLMF